MSLLSRFSTMPPAGPGRAFAVVSLLDSIGTGLYLAGATVYFVRGVGLTATQLGIGLAVAGCAGFLTTVPIGLLGDRCGARRVLIGLQLWLAVQFTLLAYVHGPVAFTAVCSLLAVAERSAPPMIQAVVADLMRGSAQVKAMAAIRTVRNAGYACGALLATALLAGQALWMLRAMLLGNAVSFVVAALLLRRLPGATPRPATAAPRRTWLPRGLGDGRFLVVTGLNAVLVLHTTLLSVGLPLWIVQHTRAPLVLVPLLFALNTVLAVGLQVWLARGAEQRGRTRRVMRWAAASLTGCCVLLAVTGHLGRAGAVVLLVAAMVLLTGGELWQSIAAWGLPVDHAPQGRRAEYLAVFNLGVTAQSILGPLLITALLQLKDAGWLVLAALFTVCGLLAAPVLRSLERHRGPAEPPAPAAVPAPAPAEPQVPLPHLPDHPACFACGTRASSGLRLRTTHADEHGITAELTLHQDHQGAPGIAHGGIVAAVLDEATSLAVWRAHRRPNVTGRLEVEYLAPVRLSIPVHVRASCTSTQGRRIHVAAELRVGAPDAPVAARASAVFVMVPAEHFLVRAGTTEDEDAAVR